LEKTKEKDMNFKDLFEAQADKIVTTLKEIMVIDEKEKDELESKIEKAERDLDKAQSSILQKCWNNLSDQQKAKVISKFIMH
jgi:phosphate uptake regulator